MSKLSNLMALALVTTSMNAAAQAQNTSTQDGQKHQSDEPRVLKKSELSPVCRQSSLTSDFGLMRGPIKDDDRPATKIEIQCNNHHPKSTNKTSEPSAEPN